MSNRKAFNFFRSYYDVAKELSDKDRLSFYDALMLEQFTGQKTKLKGMAKFAYLSQQYSIDSQIKGFNDRLKRNDLLESEESYKPLISLSEAGGEAGGEAQGKGEVEEKGEVQYVGKKIKFQDSVIFDKIKFKEKFTEWNKTKLAFYYQRAIDYSNEGNNYIDWAAAIRGWAKRDELQGRLKFENQTSELKIGEVFQPKINFY
jgi:hypothetical protein